MFLFFPLFKRNISNKSINVLTWAGMIDTNNLYEFEKQTGIKVNINLYETNDELVSKLNLTKCKDYDLITITDNYFDFCKKNDFIKKIDKSKLNFFHDIDPHLFKKNFDPYYENSLPFFWDIYGLAINKNFFSGLSEVPTWSLIFDKKISPGKISMTDDSINAVLIAAQYLFGNIILNKEKLQKVKKLLLSQKNIVETYTDLKNDFVLQTGICPVVVSQSGYVYRVIKDNPNLEFIIPKEGGFLLINLLVIPKSTQKDEYVYQFINFLYQEKVVRKQFENFGCLPVQKKILNAINLDYLGGIDYIFSNEVFSKFNLFQTNINTSEINEVWTEIKA